MKCRNIVKTEIVTKEGKRRTITHLCNGTHFVKRIIDGVQKHVCKRCGNVID